MSKKLNENIGSVEYDGIINGACNADIVTIKVIAGSYKRGTLMTGSPGAIQVPLSAKIATGQTVYVLAEDCNNSGEAVATAYRTGHFNRNKLITLNSYVLTAADEEVLRTVGILLSDAIEA